MDNLINIFSKKVTEFVKATNLKKSYNSGP